MRIRTAAAAVLIPAALAAAEVVTLVPVRDNTLYDDSTGATSNGAGPGFFVGANQNLIVRRGLIAFDIAAAIPAGATITGATLTLHMSSAQTFPNDIGLHRVLADWGEGASNSASGSGAPAAAGDATWLHTFFPGSFWVTPGGDFVGTASATTTVGALGFYSWSSLGLVADVQAFLDSPATNFGWLLRGGEDVPQSAKRFDSREHTNPAFRPVLEITYVPAPAALALFVLAPAFRRRRLPV